MWGDATAFTADGYAVAVSASLPIPAEGGGIERVPPPPPGVPSLTDDGIPPVDHILPPPPLFTEPPPPVTARPLIVPPAGIAVPRPVDSVRATTVTRPIDSWQLVIEGGRTFQLLGPRVLLGRDPVAKSGEQEIVVVDPTRTVSKTHALLEFVDDVWLVTDLGSVNGVTLIQPDGATRMLVPGIPEPVAERFALGTVLIALRS